MGLDFRVRSAGLTSSLGTISPHAREITLHPVWTLLLLSACLDFWYWLSTGTRVVPTLIEMLKDDDPQPASSPQNSWDRSGPAARAAIPQLLHPGDPRRQPAANTTAATAFEVVDLGLSPRRPNFIPRLQDTDVQQRRYGLHHPSLGTGRQTVGAGLGCRDTHDADALVRRNALSPALATIGIPPARSAMAVLAGLRDSSLVRQTPSHSLRYGSGCPRKRQRRWEPPMVNDQDKGIATLARTALEKPRASATQRHIESLGHDAGTARLVTMRCTKLSSGRPGGSRRP